MTCPYTEQKSLLTTVSPGGLIRNNPIRGLYGEGHSRAACELGKEQSKGNPP